MTGGKNKIPEFLTGGGEMGEWIRNFDWSKTPLGKPEDWEESLKTCISTILNASEDKSTFSARKKIEEKEEQLEFALDGGDLGTFDYYPQTGKLYWSDKTKEFFGLPADAEPSYEIFLNALHPEDRKRSYEVSQNALKPESGGFYENEYRTIGIDKKIRWIRSKGKITFDSDGKPLRMTGITQDITRQKEALEGNQKLASIIDASHEFIGLVAIDGTIQYGNPAAWEMIGWDTIEGKNISDCIYPEDLPLAAKLVPQLLTKGSFEHEIRFVNAKTGIPFWLQWNAFAIKDPASGEIISFGTVSTDITERKTAEIALRESEARFRSLADDSPMIVFIVEPDDVANVSYFNKTLIDYTGQAYEDTLGLAWNEYVHPEDIQKVYDSYLPAYHQRISYFIDAVRLKRYDGVYRWHMFKGNPRFTVDDEFAGFVGVGFDIHERKVAEELLRESEERFRTLAEKLPQLVWITDADGNQEFASSKWKEYTGVQPEDAGSWESIIHPADREKINKAWSYSLSSGESYKCDVRLRSKEGDYKWFAVNGEPVYDNERNIIKWVGAFTDIDNEKTFAKNLENLVEIRTDELLTKNDDLEKMNKELESFAYISSHDLQEPLRKIQTFTTRILEHDYENLSEKSRDYFKRMENAALRMKTLIEDLLAYSRTNIADRTFETTHLSEIVDEIREEFHDDLELKHGSIEAAEMCDVDIIPFQFRQLMHNLISNSLKFSRPDEAPHIVIKSEIDTGEGFHMDELIPTKKYCHISVSDNGIGFNQEYSEKIFEVFQRLHGRESYNGTGIGLAIVKKIVDNHEGVITAHSDENEGATFDIYLPSLHDADKVE